MVLAGPDPLHLARKRLALLVWLVFFAYIFVRRCGRSLVPILHSGIKLFLYADTAFVLFELAAAGISPVRAIALSTAPVLQIPWPSFWQGTLPRFGGLVADPNRAGAEIAIMLCLAFLSNPPRSPYKLSAPLRGRHYAIGSTLIFLTLSRTGLISLAIFGAIVLFKTPAKRRAALIAGTLLLCTAAATLVALSDAARSRILYNLADSPGRVNSTRVHYDLIRWGAEIALSSAKHTFIGTGWGTGYYYTRRFFPNDKYGNFHSGYISIFVEAGTLALAAYMLIVLLPIIKRHPWAPLVLVIIWANVFYQYQAAPFYWIAISALNWGRTQIPECPPRGLANRSQTPRPPYMPGGTAPGGLRAVPTL